MYSAKIQYLARRELERRRDAAQAMLENRRAEIYAKCPELVDVQATITSCGVEVIRAMAMPQDGTEFVAGLKKKSLAAQEKREELLKKCGCPPGYLQTPFSCTACSDTGLIEGRPCECHRTLLCELAFSELDKRAPLSDSRFDNFRFDFYPAETDPHLGISPRKKMEEIFRFCRSYAEDFDRTSPSLFMHGATGLGKTHLSLAIAGTVINGGSGVIYDSAQNMLAALESNHFGNGATHADYTEKELLECDLLILDDLGAEFSTQFTVSCIYNIINTRLLGGLPVIISTNLTPPELEKRYTQRITSRIIGNYASLLFSGRDVRQLKN